MTPEAKKILQQVNQPASLDHAARKTFAGKEDKPAYVPRKKQKKARMIGAETAKPAISDERANRLYFSLQVQALIMEAFNIEYFQEMDVDFRDPVQRNLAIRMRKDALSILSRMKNNSRVSFSTHDADFTEEYALEIHRVIRFFVGRDIEKIRELMDGWDKVAKHLENVGEEVDSFTYITIGFSKEELLEFEALAKRKGISEGMRRKIEATMREVREES